MIKTVIHPTQDIDVNRVFSNYKYAIPEFPAKKLSDGTWLHCYKVTKYDNDGMSLHEDLDEEQEAFDREMY